MIKSTQSPRSFQRHTISSSHNLKTITQSCQPKIKNNQIVSTRPKSYENLLKKLIQIGNYHELKNQLAPYITVNYAKITVKKQKYQYKKSIWKLFEIQNYFGRKLLQDGLFMKHWVECFLNSNQSEYISKTIFLKELQKTYQNKMTNNKDVFIGYVKELLKNDHMKNSERINNLKQINKKQGELDQKSTFLSVKKAKNSQKSHQYMNTMSLPIKRNRPDSNKKILQQKELNVQSQQQSQTYQSCKAQKWQSQSEKQKRFSGFWQANRKNNQQNSRVVKFQEQIKTNKHLQKIQTQIKERTNQNRRSQHIESIKKQIEIIEEILKRCQQCPDFITKITKEISNNLQEIQREVLKHYPKIYMVCSNKQYQTVADKGILGKYRGYTIKKMIIKQRQENELFAAVKLQKQSIDDRNEEMFQEDVQATVYIPFQ